MYNLGHNILELYNVLVQIRLTTSKKKRDIYFGTLQCFSADPINHK